VDVAEREIAELTKSRIYNPSRTSSIGTSYRRTHSPLPKQINSGNSIRIY
jgi:hypothetical protein